MCYAIPGKVVELKSNIAVLDYFGEHRNVLNEFSEVEVGDYAYAQGGVLISKVPEKEALEILKTWKDKFLELKKIDAKLSKIDENKKNENLLGILQKVNLKKELNRGELLYLLKLRNKSDLKILYQTANNIRQKEHDNACCVHGIIEFSNHCRNDCFYCGIRDSGNIDRYRMSVEEIVNAAKHAVNKLGFKAIVLQSGEDLWYDDKKLVEIIKQIRKLDILIFLSIGVRDIKTYKRCYDAGARAALLRFETSNKNIFKKLRPKTDFEERLGLIKDLKKMGYLVATGFLIGLPEETEEDILNNIILTKDLKADMYSFGPLIPAADTPLKNQKNVDKNVILKTIAISRFVDRNAKILVTTALETLDKHAKKQGLLSGANSLMVNVTPAKYKKEYVIYPRPCKDEITTKDIKEITDFLYSIGRAPMDIGL